MDIIELNFNHDYSVEIYVSRNEEISLDEINGEMYIVDLAFHTQYNWIYVEVDLIYPHVFLKKDIELEDLIFYSYKSPEYGKVLTKIKPSNKKYSLVKLIPSW